MVAAIATATLMAARLSVTAAITKVMTAVAVLVAVASNGGDSNSWGAQTTTAPLSSFQRWLFLHPPLSRGSSSTTTSVPRRHQREIVYRTQVQRTWTYLYSSKVVFVLKLVEARQKLVPREKGMCFWTFLHHLYCVEYWFL